MWQIVLLYQRDTSGDRRGGVGNASMAGARSPVFRGDLEGKTAESTIPRVWRSGTPLHMLSAR